MDFPEELVKKAEELKVDTTKHENEDSLREAIEAIEKTQQKDDDKNKTEREKYLDTELKKVIDQRDKHKKELRDLSKKVTELESKISSAPPADQLKALQEELNSLKDYKQTIEEQREEEELKKKTETERQLLAQKKEFDKEKSTLEKMVKEIQDQLNKKDEDSKKYAEQVQSLRYFRLENEIAQYALQYKAINPKQIVRLIKDEAVYDENLDKFYYPVFDGKGKMIKELDVDEKVKEFLEDEENENLVDSGVNTNSMNTKTNDSDKKTVDYGNYDPKDPKIIKEAEDRGLQVDDWIKIKIKKDEKFKKIKDKK